MTETITVTLAGRDFRVRPLTFAQLREVDEALGKARKAGPMTRIEFDSALDIIAAAVGRETPAITRDVLLDMEGTKAEIVAATRAILALSGYTESKDAPPGERQAGN